MEISEFLEQKQEDVSDTEELDVQKAVVESLAADKAEQDEHIANLKKENDALKSQVSDLTEQVEKLKSALAEIGDAIAKNNDEAEVSSKIALLDRNVELQDHFSGETRDHVLEVIKEAYEKSEAEGRLRRAQLLESVLVVNNPLGNLAKKREELNKFFNENGNILSGPVVDKLDKEGISYKIGENYMLTGEILKRMY